MRHSIFSVILSGIIVGALFFFMPMLVLGIFIFFFIIRLLHFGVMGHRWYGHGYYGRPGYGCDCGPGYGYRDECVDYGHGHEFHHGHHPFHHHPMHGKMLFWADKIRNMSEEEYSGLKDKMEKGFGFGYSGGRNEDYGRCGYGRKRDTDSDSNVKKEDTNQTNESK